MIGWLIRPLRGLVQILTAHDSSRQVAMGVVLGVILGLATPWTLISVCLTLSILILRVNRAAGFSAAALLALLTPWIDPLTHNLGARVLTIPSFQPTFARLYDAPLGPWIGFHNTVGIGSLLLGIYIAYPVYLAVHTLVDRLRPTALRWIMKYRMARVLLGADLAGRFGASGLGPLA